MLLKPRSNQFQVTLVFLIAQFILEFYIIETTIQPVPSHIIAFCCSIYCVCKTVSMCH